jgi:amino acid adenylation domain-containing protein
MEQLFRRLAISLGSADPIESVHALTPVQEGMFFESIASDDAELYLVQQRVEIRGQLNPDAFQRAWSWVVQRHAALRAVFVARGRDGPTQVVCRHVPITVDFVDLSDDPSPERCIRDHIARNRDTPFDLAQPPLLRVALFRLTPERHEMLLCQPHLLQDGWSAMNVLHELFGAYGAVATGDEPDLEPVRPFGDFIDWLESQDQIRREAFWREQLAGFRTPTRMTRVADGSPHSASIIRRFRALELDLTQALRSVARGQRISLSALLTGAVAIVVGRHTDQTDVVLAIVAAGRPPTLPGVESMVGMFINTLPLRVVIDERAKVSDWLRRVHASQAALLEHEHSPLSVVQSWSELEAGTQLTDTLVAFGNYPAGHAAGSDVTYRAVDGSGGTGFPLSITVEAVDPMKIGLHFDPSELDLQTVDRVFTSLDTLLRSIVRGTDATVGDLEILPTAEVGQLTSAHDETRADFPATCFPAVMAEQVALGPDRRAAVLADEELTYRQLDARANQLARHLQRQEVRRSDRVAVCLDRSLDLLVALIAVQKVGAAFVPLDPTLPRERLRYMTEDAEVGLLITSETISSRSFPSFDATLVALDTERAEIQAERTDAPGVALEATDLAYIIYTSGSTGLPKGVAVGHGALTNFLHSMRRRPGIDADDVLLAVTTPSFDISILELFLPLTVGATVVIADDATVLDGLALADLIAEKGVTMMQTTPTRWRLMLTGGWEGHSDLTVLCGGEPLTRELADRLLEGNREVWNLYGPTEATIWASAARIEAGTAPITIGTPIHNTWLHVLDRQMRPVPEGVPGTLYIGGKCLAQGYYGRPEQTSERFLPDPFLPDRTIYDSGDAARRTEHGIECLGRADHQVKVRGYRIELGEIERALSASASVAASAVSVWSRGPRDARLVAYYVPEPNTEVDEKELRAEMAEWLPKYMMPQHFVRLDALPQTANDKLDRGRLPDPTASVATDAAARTPRNEIEQIVSDACADLLDLDVVDLGSSFFDHGGHSVLSMRMVVLLREQTSVRLDPRILILNTLEHVAASISEQLAPRDGSEPSGQAEAPGLWPGDPEELELRGVFFGDQDRRLFGVYHTPAAGSPVPTRALLLCPPIGWEYTHAHWASHGLARMAARKGYHVLRFDYSGTGDSGGDDAHVSVGRWLADIRRAATELRDRSGTDRISIVGVRLGAALAATACARGLEADQLVLWDPVIDGPTYLQSQERMHETVVAAVRSNAGRAWSPGPDPVPSELVGFDYPEALRRELMDIDLRVSARAGPSTSIVASEDRSEYHEVVAASEDTIRLDVVPDAGEWEDPTSRNALVLVSRIPGHIISILAG